VWEWGNFVAAWRRHQPRVMSEKGMSGRVSFCEGYYLWEVLFKVMVPSMHVLQVVKLKRNSDTSEVVVPNA
jgi:hypothetical protein